MEVIVTIGERTERVRIEPEGDGRLVVTLGEQSYHVERHRLGTLESLIAGDGLQRELSTRALGNGRFLIGTRDGTREAIVVDPLTHLAEAATSGPGGRRRQRVSAYMPGRVVSVLVEAGAEIVAGQGLLVLEAMKMQNEIQAEAPGVVMTVHVEAGKTVESGDPLFDIE